MKPLKQWVAMGLFLAQIFASSVAPGLESRGNPTQGNPFAHWKNGPSHKKDFFTIGVWLQSPKKAKQYLDAARIKDPIAKLTPHQVRSEVWMSLVHGSMGLIYFVHEWTPEFNESALLSDREMLQTVRAIKWHLSWDQSKGRQMIQSTRPKTLKAHRR